MSIHNPCPYTDERTHENEVGRQSLGGGCYQIQDVKVAHTTVTAFQDLGHRKTQEDRLVVGEFPGVGGRCAFFGVFDGTVGDFASRNARDLAIPCLLDTRGWAQLQRLKTFEDRRAKAEEMMTELYELIDDMVVRKASAEHDHYTTSTSVTAFLLDDLLVVGHIGDSRIIIGYTDSNGDLLAECLTEDHKPDLPKERERIEAAGGSVEHLVNHGNKPYIRGGDFLLRKALGEKPMQLQYARAFGAKDLKMFGVSSRPDVKFLNVKDRTVRFLILASDGIWDMITPIEAVQLSSGARENAKSPAENIIRGSLLRTQQARGKSDNITATVVSF